MSEESNVPSGAAVACGALFGIFVSLQCVASDIQLRWGASPIPGITNYVIYASTSALTAANLPTAILRLNVGTNLTATVTNLTGHWYFVATAQMDGMDGLESDLSNMVQWPAIRTLSVGTLRVGP